MELIITQIRSTKKYFGNDYSNAIECDDITAMDKATDTTMGFYAAPGRFKVRDTITFEDVERECIRPEAVAAQKGD